MTTNLEIATLEFILYSKTLIWSQTFSKSTIFGILDFLEIILIAYLGQILSDFQKLSLYGKQMKFLLDQCYGRTLAHPASQVPPPLFIFY